MVTFGWNIVPTLAGNNSNLTPSGIITLPLGQVFRQTEENTNWQKANLKDSVYYNDKIKTLEKSRCEILFKKEMIIRIGEKAIVELKPGVEGAREASLNKGALWVNLFHPTNKNRFNVRTPTSVCAIRGTVYRLTCDPNQTTYRVYEGALTVSLVDESGEIIPDTIFTVNAGEELILAKNFEEYKRQQEEAFNKYLNEQKLGFEEYLREQQTFYEEFKRKERESFHQFKSFHVSSEMFDLEKDKRNSWVKWNMERDRFLEK